MGSFPSLLPMAKQVFAQTISLDLVSNEEEISRCKINFREDRLKAILEGTKFVFNEERHKPKGGLTPLPQPTGNLFYMDFKYNNVGLGTTSPSSKLHVTGNLSLHEKILEKTKSNVKSFIREERLKYILGESK